MASARNIQTAGEILGSPSELIDAPKNSKKPSRRAPTVIREYQPSEEAQIKAISALMRAAINTVLTDKRDRTANDPGGPNKRVKDASRADKSIPR